ncbi:hypothetical protein J4401_01690 [Candidatus Woesearchaeota archaeon]|nr:hypothetical protein [Candidatus Woesearchaeota archaeon]
MDWNKFFKPDIPKIAIFVLLVLIFGVPATSRDCQTYVKTSTPPPCIEKFTFSNVIIDALGLTRYPYVLDAATYFSYNPSVVIFYLTGLYVSLSSIFHIADYNWKKASLYTVTAILLTLLITILFSVMKNRAF